MNGYDTSDEHRPITYLNGYPIYAAHFIVVVYVVSMLACTILNAATFGHLLQPLVFDGSLVLKGQVWRVLSYGLYNPPSIPFVIEMFMIGWFGREVERFLGRRTFFLLYGCLYLITPLLLTALAIKSVSLPLAGATGGFALFIAFASIYPNAPIFFNILAKWLALILVGIYTLIALSGHQWTDLLTLWATTGLAYGFIRYHQGRLSLPRVPRFRRKPKLRVLPDPVDIPPARSSRDESMAEIDALLDKIAQSGIGSLTAKERAKLDAAQADLLRKKTGRS